MGGKDIPAEGGDPADPAAEGKKGWSTGKKVAVGAAAVGGGFQQRCNVDEPIVPDRHDMPRFLTPATPKMAQHQKKTQHPKVKNKKYRCQDEMSIHCYQTCPNWYHWGHLS